MTVNEVKAKLDTFMEENPKATKAQLVALIGEISKDLEKVEPEVVERIVTVEKVVEKKEPKETKKVSKVTNWY